MAQPGGSGNAGGGGRTGVNSCGPDEVRDQVSWPLRVTAAWAWRFLVVTAAIALIVLGLNYVRSLVIALLVALLLALLLLPLVNFLKTKLKMGRTLAAIVGLLVGLALVVVLVGVAAVELVAELPYLTSQTMVGFDRLVDWVASGPLGYDSSQVVEFMSNLQNDLFGLLKSHGSAIASEAWLLASSALSIAASSLIMIFVLYFVLREGRSMWISMLRMLPKQWREPADEAAIRGWVTVGSYVRTQVKVAAIDAVGIGLGALFLGLPAVLPITVLVFLSAFIPVLGAFVSGFVAIMIALVNNGIGTAAIMLVIVLAVQQIESNVLQPWLMSKAVALHPVPVVLAVVAGSALAGIPGAVFSVPLLAFLNVAIKYLQGYDTYPELATDPGRPGGPPGGLADEVRESYGNVALVGSAAAQHDPEQHDPGQQLPGSKDPGAGDRKSKKRGRKKNHKPR